MRKRILVGETVDQRYDIIEVVDDSGSGVICRATDRNSGNKPVVLKVMHADLSSNPLERERFVLEGGLALTDDRGKLISQVVGSGLIDNRVPYMAVDDVPGKSLKDLLKEAPEGLAPDYALRIGIRICDALKDLHSRHIVHRDLRPAIIKLVNDYPCKVEIRILEFGLARFIATSRRPETLTKTGMIIGTAAEYMAPEQCKGLLVDEGADIYAVGCILYEMLTGKPPFSGNSPAELMHHQISTAPPDISDKPCAHLYPLLEQVLWRALAKNRNERYFSADDLSADLKALIDNVELMPFRPASVRIDRKDTRSYAPILKRWWLPPAVLALGLLVTWGFCSDFFLANMPGAIEQVKQTALPSPPDHAGGYLHDRVPDSLVVKYPRELSICIENADRCYSSRSYLRATKILERYLASAKDPAGLLIAKGKLGDIYSRIGNEKLAKLNLQSVLRSSEISRNLSIVCRLALANSENLSKGKQTLQEVLKQDDLSRFERVVIARKVADDLALQGFKQEAASTLLDVLKSVSVRTVLPEDDLSVTRQLDSALIDLYALQVSSNPKSVLKSSYKLLAKSTLLPEQIFSTLKVRATAYEALNELALAEKDLETSLKYKKAAGYRYQQTLAALSRVQMKQGKTGSAAAYRQEAYDLAVSAHDPAGMEETAPLSASTESSDSTEEKQDLELEEAPGLGLVQLHLIAESKGKQAQEFLSAELRRIQDARWQTIVSELQE
ncbi:MAG: serine/threonine protein kinase [Candidatus Obscuribacterales bacterium]|nr:serine/threonine protein kinase [Candidatus Obscuribacterales bacterium]